MLFAPREKLLENVVVKEPTKLEKWGHRVDAALSKIFHIHEDEEIVDWKENFRKYAEKNPDKAPKVKTAVELPRGIIRDARNDFKQAFPKYASEFEETDINYYLGYSHLSNEDIRNHLDLLSEPGTLMGESWPMYEVLTQILSEKAAASHKGVWGKIFGMMSKITGYMSYRLDVPVVREWNNVDSHLRTMYGNERTDEIIENMYFGGKDEYQKFLTSCEQAKLDFPASIERAKKNAFFIDKIQKLIVKNPKILNNPVLVGGLDLPGKVHDMWVPTVIGEALAIGGIGALLTAAGAGSEAYVAYAGLASTIAGFGIGAGGIGIVFHELTHLYGGNFRRKLKEIREKKI